MCVSIVFIAVLALSVTQEVQAGPMFMGLGGADSEFSSYALGVSGDGSVVVGQIQTTGGYFPYEAFRWTAGGGMVRLGYLPGGGKNSVARAASANGGVVVGNSDSALVANGQVFRWTIDEGMVAVGDPPAVNHRTVAWSVSVDGSVVVGHRSTADGNEAFAWTGAGSMLIGPQPSSFGGTYAQGVSADGSVIVGFKYSRSVANDRAFRWTQAEGTAYLGDPRNHSNETQANSISADGSTTVGDSRSFWGREAVLWRDGGPMIVLGDLPGGLLHSTALDVSGDGSVVVGNDIQQFDTPSKAFIWDEHHGIRPLDSVLTAMGLDLRGWALERAEAVSDDGLTIVGYGTNPSGFTEAFIAVLPAPEPSSNLLAACTVLTLAMRRRCLLSRP